MAKKIIRVRLKIAGEKISPEALNLHCINGVSYESFVEGGSPKDRSEVRALVGEIIDNRRMEQYLRDRKYTLNNMTFSFYE